jgi:hypothetical protein
MPDGPGERNPIENPFFLARRTKANQSKQTG